MSGEDHTTRNVIIGILVVLFLLWAISPSGCSSSTKSNSSNSSSSVSTSNSSSNRSSSSTFSDDYSYRSIPSYADERWPTNNSQLLAIPESSRYYNAYNHIGQTHAVAGPVAKVYQATQSNGMPIFVDIGVKSMPSDWFTLVIWAEDLDSDLERMLNAVDHGNAWLEVTGEIYLYNGRLQIQTGHGYIEYQWWTNVN